MQYLWSDPRDLRQRALQPGVSSWVHRYRKQPASDTIDNVYRPAPRSGEQDRYAQYQRHQRDSHMHQDSRPRTQQVRHYSLIRLPAWLARFCTYGLCTWIPPRYHWQQRQPQRMHSNEPERSAVRETSNIDEPPLLCVRPSLWKCYTSDERTMAS